MERRSFLKKAGVGLVAGVAAAPAIAQNAALPTIKWRMASSFPKTIDTLHGSAEFLIKRIADMTGGKFQIQLFAAGELVPGPGVHDAVKDNTVEIGYTCSYYYYGKNPVYCIDTSIPFGMNSRQIEAWYRQGNGAKLMDEFFAKSNLISIPSGNSGTQMGGWFRKEINSVADLQGVKMRIPGLGGQVMAKLGVTVQALPANEIFQALQTGAIDAAEWVGPYDDEKLGFYKVAKNYYYPGFWESGPTIHFFVNKKEWDKLPKEYQAAFQAAAYEANVTMMAEYDHKNPIALAKLLQNGVKLQKFSDEILGAAYKAAQQIYADEAGKNPAFKKIYTEWEKYRKTQNAWFSLAEARMDGFLQSHK